MIELTIEKVEEKYVFTFKYGNTMFFGEINEEKGKFKTLIPEKPARELMNLCMRYLRELKEQKIEQERPEVKIKFYGVDY